MRDIPKGVFLIFCLDILQRWLMNDIKNVCVYSASSTKIDQSYFDAAEKLGKILAERKINLINGAGCLGLMCAISDATLQAGGTVTGVIPHFMVEQGWHHKGLLTCFMRRMRSGAMTITSIRCQIRSLVLNCRKSILRCEQKTVIVTSE